MKEIFTKEIFRREAKEISDDDKEIIDIIKEAAQELFIHFSISSSANPNEMALAIRKLEESVMWATKAITAKYYEQNKEVKENV